MLIGEEKSDIIFYTNTSSSICANAQLILYSDVAHGFLFQ
jgi:hypothetical protein